MSVDLLDSAVRLAPYGPRSWEPVLSRVQTDEVVAAHPEIGPPSTSSGRTWLRPTIEHLEELAGLPDNWDGRGSARPLWGSLIFALSVLDRVMPPTAPPPSIIPLGNGGIQLVWHSDAGELEIEVIRPNETFIFHLDKSSGVEREWRATQDFSALNEILQELLRA